MPVARWGSRLALALLPMTAAACGLVAGIQDLTLVPEAGAEAGVLDDASGDAPANAGDSGASDSAPPQDGAPSCDGGAACAAGEACYLGVCDGNAVAQIAAGADHACA